MAEQYLKAGTAFGKLAWIISLGISETGGWEQEGDPLPFFCIRNVSKPHPYWQATTHLYNVVFGDYSVHLGWVWQSKLRAEGGANGEDV